MNSTETEKNQNLRRKAQTPNNQYSGGAEILE